MDVSIILMMNTPKYTSFAWNYKDGAEPKEKLSDDQYQRRIEKLPGFWQYFSYIFFYASSLVGPAFDFKEYDDFINLRGDFEKLPSSFIPAIKSLFGGFLCMALLINLNPIFPQKEYGGDIYLSKPLHLKYVYLTMASFMGRLRYYSGWLLSTSNCISSGLSYNGKDQNGNNKWDRVISIKVFEFETSDNLRDKLEAWNYSIQNWLRKYIFYRIIPENQIKFNSKKAAFASNGKKIFYKAN